MTRPVPSLIDVAAGRPARSEPGLVASAIEHRMGGLLMSAVEDGTVALTAAELTELTASELATMNRHRRLWGVLSRVASTLGAVDIQLAAIKGVTNEARWFRRLGERPCSDIDVVLSPHCVDRIDEALALLAPGYPTTTAAVAMVRRRQLQHVHFELDGVTVDLHMDPLKLGVWIGHPELWWSSTESLPGLDGAPIRVLAPELALVTALIHLNKDRFAYLGYYAEVARMVVDPGLDWDRMRRFVAAEGLDVPVWASLAEVVARLDLALEMPVARDWRWSLWDRWWPAANRLGGHEGRHSGHRRQILIPALMPGRGRETVVEWRRRILPPRQLIEVSGGEPAGHSYLRRVTVDRLARS